MKIEAGKAYRTRDGRPAKVAGYREGLSLLEAMQSGKEFRRIGYGDKGYWIGTNGLTWVSTNKPVVLYTYDLTDRYELKPDPMPPKSVEVTAADIDAAVSVASDFARLPIFDTELIRAKVKQHLGLTDDGK